jgi:hypothetical protein
MASSWTLYINHNLVMAALAGTSPGHDGWRNEQ